MPARCKKESVEDIGVPGTGRYVWHVAEDRVAWSPGLSKLYGVAHAPDSEPGFAAMVHPEDRVRVEGETTAFLQSGASYSHEFRIIRPDGVVRHIHDRGAIERAPDGRAVRLRGLNIDVTGQRDPHPSGSSARLTAETLLRHAPFGVYLVDADLRVVQVSDGARKAFEPIRAVIGQPLGDILRAAWPAPLVDRTLARFRHVLDTGEPYEERALVEQRCDTGDLEGYDWRLQRIAMADGRPGVVCHFYDLTDRIAREREARDGEAWRQLAFEAAGMGIWDLDLIKGRFVWSRELYDLVGLPHEAPPSPELFFAHVHEDDRAFVEAAFEDAIRDTGVFEAEFRMRRADGRAIHVAGRGRIVQTDDGQPRRMVGVNFDVTERRRAELEVRHNAQRLRDLIDSAVSFIALMDHEGRVSEINAAPLNAGGMTRDQVIGAPFWETYWWGHDAELAAQVRAQIVRAAQGEIVRDDATVRMIGDTRMDVHYMLSPVRDADGAVREIVASGFDITERKQAERHVRLLMREVNHRTQNAYALADAIARQTHRHDPVAFLDKFTRRLRALSSAQGLLLDERQGAGASIERLARTQLAHFDEALERQITLEGPELELGAQAAQALGLAIHELGVNAAKHGALSAPEGRVRLAWAVQDDALTLSWTESGGSPVRPPSRAGFGSVVLGALTEGSLHGRTTLEHRPQGVAWRLRCPLASLKR